MGKPRPYNYFEFQAAGKLLCLILGPNVQPHPDQVELAYQIVNDIERFTASKAGTK